MEATGKDKNQLDETVVQKGFQTFSKGQKLFH
jgi:cell division protein FtsL